MQPLISPDFDFILGNPPSQTENFPLNVIEKLEFDTIDVSAPPEALYCLKVKSVTYQDNNMEIIAYQTYVAYGQTHGFGFRIVAKTGIIEGPLQGVLLGARGNFEQKKSLFANSLQKYLLVLPRKCRLVRNKSDNSAFDTVSIQPQVANEPIYVVKPQIPGEAYISKLDVLGTLVKNNINAKDTSWKNNYNTFTLDIPNELVQVATLPELIEQHNQFAAQNIFVRFSLQNVMVVYPYFPPKSNIMAHILYMDSLGNIFGVKFSRKLSMTGEKKVALLAEETEILKKNGAFFEKFKKNGEPIPESERVDLFQQQNQEYFFGSKSSNIARPAYAGNLINLIVDKGQLLSVAVDVKGADRKDCDKPFTGVGNQNTFPAWKSWLEGNFDQTLHCYHHSLIFSQNQALQQDNAFKQEPQQEKEQKTDKLQQKEDEKQTIQEQQQEKIIIEEQKAEQKTKEQKQKKETEQQAETISAFFQTTPDYGIELTAESCFQLVGASMFYANQKILEKDSKKKAEAIGKLKSVNDHFFKKVYLRNLRFYPFYGAHFQAWKDLGTNYAFFADIFNMHDESILAINQLDAQISPTFLPLLICNVLQPFFLFRCISNNFYYSLHGNEINDICFLWILSKKNPFYESLKLFREVITWSQKDKKKPELFDDRYQLQLELLRFIYKGSNELNTNSFPPFLGKFYKKGGKSKAKADQGDNEKMALEGQEDESEQASDGISCYPKIVYPYSTSKKSSIILYKSI